MGIVVRYDERSESNGRAYKRWRGCERKSHNRTDAPSLRAPNKPQLFYRHWHSEEARKRIVEAYSKFNALTLLIDAGAYVNAKDNADRTPLHYAAKRGDYPGAKALLDAGADTAATDKNGRTPADYAAAQGYDDLVELLR